MNPSTISSTAGPQRSNATEGFRHRMRDFMGLAHALQSGDLSAAQSALSTLKSDLQGAPTNRKAAPLLDLNTPVGKDFKALQDALQSGDIKAARDVFATLKKDFRSAQHVPARPHRVDHDGDNAEGKTSSATDAPGFTTPSSSQETDSTLDVTA